MSEQIFSIVVADDEPELLEAMCSLIDWEAAGFRLVGSAGNGLDALQIVERVEPDLLLTDIQMPFITGTALARQVKELQPLIQVAFLSGYDDFAYAQSAIDSQVISYLLKPISMEELTLALKDIHRKMEEKFKALAPSEGEASSLPLALSSLLLDSYETSLPEEDLRGLLEECGMSLDKDTSFRVLALSSEREGLLPQSAAQTADKCLQGVCGGGSFVSGHRILSLLSSDNNFAGLGGALDELYYAAKHVQGCECTIGVSNVFSELRQAAAACREAVDAARMADGPGISFAGADQNAPQKKTGISALVDEAMQIIRRRYMEEDLSLGSVSDELHVSPNYLSANMKKYAGDTFLNLLIKQRMEAAEALLKGGGMKISEIAQRCGYSDQHYFSFCFKKYYGVSPARMRRSREEQS